MRTLLALALLLLAPGCFLSRQQTNEELFPEAVGSLRPGTDTADDVVRLLGAPAEVVQLGRRSAWRYEHILTKRAGLFLLVITFLNEDTKSDRIWVFFDENDRLTHVGSLFASEQVEWQMPWQDSDARLEEAQEEIEEEE